MSNIKQVYTNCCYKSYCFSDNYYSDDENDTELDLINIYNECSHREIIDRCDFGQNHMIHARLSSNKSLIQEQVQTSIKTTYCVQIQIMVMMARQNNKHIKLFLPC